MEPHQKRVVTALLRAYRNFVALMVLIFILWIYHLGTWLPLLDVPSKTIAKDTNQEKELIFSPTWCAEIAPSEFCQPKFVRGPRYTVHLVWRTTRRGGIKTRQPIWLAGVVGSVDELIYNINQTVDPIVDYVLFWGQLTATICMAIWLFRPSEAFLKKIKLA